MGINNLKRDEKIKLRKIVKKNILMMLIILIILFSVMIGIGILINIEFKNLSSNYNILVNSILERTRSYYFGFKDGLLQYHTCDDNLSYEVEIEMSSYLAQLTSMISSYPFTACINIFELKPIFANILTLSYVINKKYDYFKLLSSFNDVIEDIDNCMNDILSDTLAKQSIFLKQPIIDSKKQLWSMHQKMSNLTNSENITENLFGSKTLICNYFMIFDLEGGPRITGVVVNGTVYQAPLFKVDNVIPINSEKIRSLSSEFDDKNLNFEFISKNNEYERSITNDVYEFLSRKLHPMNFKEISLLKKLWENNGYKNNFKNKSNSEKNHKPYILNREIQSRNKGNLHQIESDNINGINNTSFNSFITKNNINESNIVKSDESYILDNLIYGKTNSTFTSKFSGMRTIYIPTSPILSNIQVFVTGMKELERSINNHLKNNISNIKIFAYLIFFTTIFISLLVFIPLILVETEKTKEIFSLYAHVVTERFRYFQTKYLKEMIYSAEATCLLFSKLIININEMLDREIEKKRYKTGELLSSNNSNIPEFQGHKNQDTFLIIKQLTGVIKYNNYILWELSYFMSYCLRVLVKKMQKTKLTNEKFYEDNIGNFNLFLELIISLLSKKYPNIKVEYSPEIFNKNFENTNFTNNNTIASYLVVSTLIYSIKLIFEYISIISIRLEDNGIQLRIKLENIFNKIKNFDINNLLKEAKKKCKFKSINNFRRINIEDYILENDWFEFLFEQGNIVLNMHTNQEHELLLEIHRKYKTENFDVARNKKINIFQQNKDSGVLKLILLSNKCDSNSHYFLINEACSKFGFNIIWIESSNDLKKEIFKFNSKILVIFIEKNYSKVEELGFILFDKRSNTSLQSIIIYWLEEADPIYINRLWYNHIAHGKSIDGSNYVERKSFYKDKSNLIDEDNKLSNFTMYIDTALENGPSLEYNDKKTNISNNNIRQYLIKNPITPIKILILINKLLNKYKNQELSIHFSIHGKNDVERVITDYYYYYVNLSRQNFFANNMLLYRKFSKLEDLYKGSITEKNLSKEYFQLYKRGVPIEIIKNIYSFHFIPKLDEFLNIKNIILDRKNCLKNQDKILIENKGNINYNLSTIFDLSIDQIKIEMRKVILDIFSLLSISDKIFIKSDLIMEVYEIFISKIFSNIKNMDYLQFFGPHLVLHSIVVFKLFLKSSVPIIENMTQDKDLVTSFIICFMAIPLCKPGISSEILSLTNSMISLYTNESPSIENYVCNIVNRILNLPKFAILFDNFEVSFK